MCPSCNVKKQSKVNTNEGSLNLQTNMTCNYVHCKHDLLVTMAYHDTSCNNWFHHLCQN